MVSASTLQWRPKKTTTNYVTQSNYNCYLDLFGILLWSRFISSDHNFFSLLIFCALVVGDFLKHIFLNLFFLCVSRWLFYCSVVKLPPVMTEQIESVSNNLSLFITINSGWNEFLCIFLQNPMLVWCVAHIFLLNCLISCRPGIIEQR